MDSSVGRGARKQNCGLAIARIVVQAALGVLCFTACLNSQERVRCDTDILSATEKHIGRLGESEWAAFFAAIKADCKGDVGFMGWVNDLLFRSLESQPAQFMDAFDHLPRITQRLILDELSAPGHPGLDAASTYDAARDAPAPAASKQRILQALTKAGCRCGAEVIE